MSEAPFGLSPQAFSMLIVVGWLVLLPLVASFFMRKKMRRMFAAGEAAQEAQQAPPVYPSLTAPAYPHLVGVWQFKSATRWIGIIFGVLIGLIAVQLPTEIAAPALAGAVLVIAYPFWRGTRAAQRCSVDPNLRVTFGRGGREIPLDLNHYRYVRMHVTTSRGWSYPSMMVLDRDSYPGFFTLASSTLFPRFGDARIVVFHNRWWTADGGLIPPGTIDDLFRDACRRAGHEPVLQKTWGSMSRTTWRTIGSKEPWEIRPY